MQPQMQVHQRHETSKKCTRNCTPEAWNHAQKCTRKLIQCACKDLFWTFEFFTTKEEVLDFSMKGLWGEMTMGHFNIEPKNWCSHVTSISRQLRKESPTAGRHAMQTLIGKDLKSKFTWYDQLALTKMLANTKLKKQRSGRCKRVVNAGT